MITTTQIQDLNNIPPKIKKKEPPRSINKHLTPLYNNSLFVGAKNSGKTYGLVKFLKNYEEFPIYNSEGEKLIQKIVLFSPTAHSSLNPIYHSLKHLDWDKDVVLDYSDDKLQVRLDEIEELKFEIEKYKAYKKAYQRFLKNKVSKLTEEELILLYDNDFIEPEDMKPEYENMPVFWFVLDDLVGDNKAFKKGNCALSNLCIKHRHLGINLIFTSQYLRAIPPVIRRNIDIYVLYKFANKQSVIEQIYPEVSSLCTEEQFEEMYSKATEEEHSALVIDNHPKTPKNERFKVNFDKIINLNSYEDKKDKER